MRTKKRSKASSTHCCCKKNLTRFITTGTDVDCGDFVTTNAQSALDQNLITEGDLDERIRQQWRVRMRLGHFEKELSYLDSLVPDEEVRSEACD